MQIKLNANNYVDSNDVLTKLNSVDKLIDAAQNRSSLQEMETLKTKYPYLAQCHDFKEIINAGLSKDALNLIEQSISAYETDDDIYYDEDLCQLVIPDDINVNMDAVRWYAGMVDTKDFIECIKEYDLDLDNEIDI